MKILNEETVFKNNFLDMVETDYIKKTGETGKWIWVQRPNQTKAVMIVATYGDRLVVTREFRVPLGGYEWGFPAGLVGQNEDIIEAGKRELKEETNLDVKAVFTVSPPVYNSAGITDESIHIMRCIADGTPDDLNTEDSEDITTFLMTAEEIAVLMESDVFIGAKAYIYFERFIETGEI